MAAKTKPVHEIRIGRIRAGIWPSLDTSASWRGSTATASGTSCSYWLSAQKPRTSQAFTPGKVSADG